MSQIDIPTPKKHLIAIGKKYPDAWRQVDLFRAGRGADLPAWPDWCFLPIAGWYSIVCREAQVKTLNPTLPPESRRLEDIGTLAALGTWRVTQGIYRFDPDLYAALISTPITGDLPCDLLYRLPEWCVYIETPGYRWKDAWKDAELRGFFAHLESDVSDGRVELRLALDMEPRPWPMVLHLGEWPLDEAVARALSEGEKNLAGHDWKTAAERQSDMSEVARMALEHLPPLLSLLLYLCSENADFPVERPTNPKPKRTKKHGWRIFPAEATRVWEVGMRIGAALRRGNASEPAQGGGASASPRPHIRRAHWHTYLTGVGRTERRLKWLPPIPVKVEDMENLPVTVRKVKLSTNR